MLFFHGNAEDIGIAYDILQEIKNCFKVTIFAMEYQGYGLYFGTPESDSLLEDSLLVFDHLTQVLGVSPSDIIVFGRSIGSSPACYVARHRNPGALILMSPFKSIKELARDLVGWVLSLLIADRFRNIDLIKEIKSPVFIVHGQQDKLIHYSHSQELHDSCHNSIYSKLFLPPKMDHNDFDFDGDFIEPVQEFFKQINLDTLQVAPYFTGLHFSDDYYFPTPAIVKYEKTLIKSSIIWDIIEDRKKQLHLKAMKRVKAETYRKHELTISALDMEQTVKSKTQSPRNVQDLDSSDLLNTSGMQGQRIRVSVKNSHLKMQQSNNGQSMNKSFDFTVRAKSNDKKQKYIKMLDDGMEWNPRKTIGVRNKEERITLKFQ